MLNLKEAIVTRESEGEDNSYSKFKTFFSVPHIFVPIWQLQQFRETARDRMDIYFD